MKKVITILFINILVLSIVSCSNKLSINNNQDYKAQGTNTISPTQNKTDNDMQSSKSKEVDESMVSSVAKNNEIQLKGTLNNNLKVHMNIQVTDGKVQGSYYYDNYKTYIL